MESIIVKEENGDSIGVLFVENREVSLIDIRRQMMEEIDEFLPKKFYFMSVWGVPMSSVQEKKNTLNHVLDDDGYLVIKPSNISQKTLDTPKTTTNEDDEGTQEIPPSQQGNINKDEGEEILAPTRAKKAKRSGQSTLTLYFGASSKPAIMRATALARKGVHVNKEHEIEEAKGTERKRRIFWNENAEEVCKDNNYDGFKADEIDKLLHEKWRLHKASILKEEDQAITAKIDDILLKSPDVMSKMRSSRKIKSQTIKRNLERVDSARKALEKSRQGLHELYSQCRQQEKIKEKQELHRAHYKELQKAEDAFRQSLEVKKRFLSELTEKLGEQLY